MVKRCCPKCNAEFDRKCNYDYHMNKKFDCSPNCIHSNDVKDAKNEDLPEFAKICENLPEFAKICESKKNDEIFLKKQNFSDLTETNDLTINTSDASDSSYCCSYCNKKYSSKYTLLRHMNDVCKIKKENDEKKENIFKLLLDKDRENNERIVKLEKQNKMLMDKIDKLISLKENSKSSKTINNNQNITNDNKTITNNLSNSNNNTQNNNIVMVNFGKEDLSIIDEKLFIDRIIKKNTVSGVKIPDEVLKIIHFNPIYPQLSNIYISDINREKCMVWDDGE